MSFLIINTLSMAFIFTLTLNQFIGIKIIYFFWVFIVYFVQVGMLILTPSCLSKCFGNKNVMLMSGLKSFIGVAIIDVNFKTNLDK